MKSYFCLVLCLLTISLSSAQAESRSFDIIHNHKSIGVLEIESKPSGEGILYSSHTKISYHLLVSIVVDYKYEVLYHNDQLEHANVKIYLHGKERTNVSTIASNGVYEFMTDEEVDHSIKEEISYSTVLLLFKEPKSVSRVYAEEHGVFHSIKASGDGSYIKTDTKGNQSTYHYEQGKLAAADVDAGVIAFSIKAVD